MEIYLHATGFFGKDQNNWPASYVPGIGMLFRPGEELRHTKGLEFAVSQRANSLGFLDWEPKIPKPPGTFRILLVGDSIIEAIQVAMEQKVQSQLAKILEKNYPRQKVDVVAMGYSGTGQSSQLPYFQFYKERIQADLIVLFFAANDFSNNSILLESIRYGVPAHNIPFLFLEKDHAETCKRLPLPSSFTTERTLGATYSERVNLLRRTSSAIDVKFGDWDPDKMDIDSVFFEDKMPPAFEEAVELTKCSFQMWKQEADGIGVPILVVATQHVTGYGLIKRPPKTGQIDRLRTMLSQLQIPLLDLYQATAASGDWREARWKYDGHWNPVGHRWAANALSDYLKQQGYLERPGERAASAP
jgi:lysophospholipase L1-like esterase